MFLGFNHSPYPKETGRCQKFIGTFYMHAHGMKNGLHGDQTILEKKFTGSTTPPALAKIFLTGMLTCDLFQ